MKTDVPSLKTLATATLIALAVACVILMAFVLPAEYGVDPLGTGRALGLTDLASATEQPSRPVAVSGAPAAPEPPRTFINPVRVPAASGPGTVKDAFIAEPGRWQLDSREITLARGEGMEIKYNMKKGAGLVYSWTASAPLLFEFHGEPDVKPAGREGTDYFESYQLDDKAGKTEWHGTFLAPSTGIHGWFWENKSGKEVTLKLASAGYFDWVTQNRKNKHTAFKPTDSYSLPSHPKVPDELMR